MSEIVIPDWILARQRRPKFKDIPDATLQKFEEKKPEITNKQPEPTAPKLRDTLF